MRMPVIKGLIDRRILVNYRVDPAAIAEILPKPFRPKLIDGHAMAGICLIRLKNLRPRFIPIHIGVGSENAAHRITVEWDEAGKLREGVYVPRRDTDSRLNVLAGGRIFPGVHHHAAFIIDESDEQISVSVKSDDGQTRLSVTGHVTDHLPDSSIFSSLAEASAFFEAGSLGYSPTGSRERLEGLELNCKNWNVQPLEIEHVESSFFEDSTRFPPGTVSFDNALLMHGIEHEWHSRGDLCCSS